MKRTISTLLGLAILCLFAEAQAVPATVSFTGRLSTSTGPVSGAVTVTFSFFNQATNGTVVWTETRSLTATSTGLVYADLGSMTTLDADILDNAPLYLEIQVGAEVLTPRLPLQSVPYAIRSEVANTAETLGTIGPGDVVTTVNASGGISANRSGNTVTLTGTGVSGTAPIAAAGGNVSLTTCAANQIYKMTGGTWQCSADANTTYTAAANGGINVSGTTIGLLTTCSAGQVLKAGAGGQWACASDTDTNTTYSATTNGGLTFNGTQIGLLTTCSAGQVLKAAAGGTWACANDNNTTYTDAQAVAAVEAQTVTHYTTVGPTDFALAKQDGTAIGCSLPATNCSLPVGVTTMLHFSMHVPGPATMVSVSCIVLDNDATGNVTLAVYNGSTSQATVSTSGATVGPQTITAPVTFPISTGSRGPAVRMSFASVSGQPVMQVYQCYATYTTDGL